MATLLPDSPLLAILADPWGVALTIGREAATELGIAALEHLEGDPEPRDVQALVAYAARHDESAPARDALVAVLLNASGTIRTPIVEHARSEIQGTDWGPGRESAGLNADPAVGAVPRRHALSERMRAERARRLRPRMHAVIAGILAQGEDSAPVPRWFLERNWVDLRDALVQRVRNEPMHRDVIARWHAAQHPAVRAWLQPIEDMLIEVTTQAILQTPQRAPVAPYCGAELVAERVRTAVNYRGEYARIRLGGYLARVTPGTDWYETIRAIVHGDPD